MAPEIPTAIYKLVATGFPVCPTCSACGLQPKSETGLEQAVAAPKSAAKSSIKFQSSGPFYPRPPDTTISASAIDTFPDAFSIDSTFIPKSWSPMFGLKVSSVKVDALSKMP